MKEVKIWWIIVIQQVVLVFHNSHRAGFVTLNGPSAEVFF